MKILFRCLQVGVLTISLSAAAYAGGMAAKADAPSEEMSMSENSTTDTTAPAMPEASANSTLLQTAATSDYSRSSIPSSNRRSALPFNAVMGIVIDPEGNPIVVDREGRAVKQCRLCDDKLSERYGKRCEKAPENANLCPGSTLTTLRDLSSISVLHNTGSYCYTIGIRGNMFAYCY